ncbi:MAG: hypothetical protein WC702_00595 [Patescibacteria group bacterium]|jgi:purine-nucleoside phosphorylase
MPAPTFDDLPSFNIPLEIADKGCCGKALRAAEFLYKHFGLSPQMVPRTLIVLGSGLGEALVIKDEQAIDLSEIPGFEGLPTHPTHKRQLCFGSISGRLVFVLRGRIHLNEGPNDQAHLDRLRLMTEMFCVIGVKNYVLTAAVGAIYYALPWWKRVFVPNPLGAMAFIDGFFTQFAPVRCGRSAEFACKEGLLDPELIQKAERVARLSGFRTVRGVHGMIIGPYFETWFDKLTLAKLGVKVVGMSILPEVDIVSLYNDGTMRVLPVGLVTNLDRGRHSDKEIRAKVGGAVVKFADFIGGLLQVIG